MTCDLRGVIFISRPSCRSTVGIFLKLTVMIQSFYFLDLLNSCHQSCQKCGYQKRFTRFSAHKYRHILIVPVFLAPPLPSTQSGHTHLTQYC